MADIAPTQAIHGGAGLVVVSGIAGETLAATDWVYRASDDAKWWKIDVNDATRMAKVRSAAFVRNVLGIVMFGGAADAAVDIAVWGPVNLGTSIMTAGVAYYGSDNIGKARPAADNGSGDYLVFYGTAYTASIMYLAPAYHGIALV